MSNFWVNGIVAQRDKQPYIQLSNEKGMIAQLSMGEARQIAFDILHMAARTEMDAMVFHFCESAGMAEAAGLMMQSFRDYRAKVDQEKVTRSESDV